MSSVSELALKGHFELLKKQYESKRGEGVPKDLMKVVSKAISMAEDIYEHDKEFFTPDHKEDYQLMIKTLNAYGHSYQGHPDLMEKSADLPAFDKKPMQKAGKKKNQDEGKNKKAS